MRLHDIFKTMPKNEYVNVRDSDGKLLFRGTVKDALEVLKNGEVFTFFPLSDYEFGNILSILLED